MATVAAARESATARTKPVTPRPSEPRTVAHARLLPGDRFLKRLRYREAGVPLYWVVDGDERSVEVWTPRDDFPAVERERLVWRPSGADEPFTLSLEELFRRL